jgi:hypothetical protein
MSDGADDAQMKSRYDHTVVMKAAEAKQQAGDVPGAQMMYRSALLDWIDDAREGTDLGIHPDHIRQAIAALWIGYARLNRDSNMVRSHCTCFFLFHYIICSCFSIVR